MASYLLVKDICNCEDYPCCGHSQEAYPMYAPDARELAKKGRVRIIGDYNPPIFW